MSNHAEIITPETAQAMVKVYQETEKDVILAYGILDQARQKLITTFGGKEVYHNFSLIPDRYDNFSTGETALKIMRKVRITAWQDIVGRLEFHKFLTVQRSKELEENIENDTMGELTVEHIFHMLEELVTLAPDLAKEAVKEAYSILKRGYRVQEQYTSHKVLRTNIKNAKYDIGEKIIMEHVEEHSLNRYKASDWTIGYGRSSDELRIIDKVFHLLDGKPFEYSYRCPLIDAISLSGKNNLQPIGETNYFSWKGYMNGNLHLAFRRMDLVKRLNAVAAEPNTLKGE
jgi:hypothetical protein